MASENLNKPNDTHNKTEMEKTLNAKAERIKKSLKQLEMRIFDGIDESTQMTRVALKSMGLGASPTSPILQIDDDEESSST